MNIARNLQTNSKVGSNSEYFHLTFISIQNHRSQQWLHDLAHRTYEDYRSCDDSHSDYLLRQPPPTPASIQDFDFAGQAILRFNLAASVRRRRKIEKFRCSAGAKHQFQGANQQKSSLQMLSGNTERSDKSQKFSRSYRTGMR